MWGGIFAMFAPKFCEKRREFMLKSRKKRRFLLKFLKILQNLRKIFGIFAKNPYLCNVKIKEITTTTIKN